MFDVEGVILVGGKSSRMGRDKAQLVFNGKTSIELIATELSAVTSSISLVGARPSDRHHSLNNVPDTHPGWGALGGIHAALGACRQNLALIVACDLPFVTRELFGRLVSFAGKRANAIVPIQPDGRPQPLCALYERETCRPQAERLIETGEHTPRALLAEVETRWIEFGELEDLTGARNFFLNVNTPADFDHATKIFSRETS